MILYLDRAAISSAKTSVAAALSLSDAAMGAVFSAFALGYAFAQIPSGWLADRFGPRVTLACVVALWSVFTVLTGVASGLATLLVVRFLFWRRRGRRVPRIGSRHLQLAAATNARYRERHIIFWRAGGRSHSISVFPMALSGARLAHGFFSSRRPGGRLGVLLVVLLQRFSK